MFQRLTTQTQLEGARQQIGALLREHAEWFCTPGKGAAQSIRRSEIDISISQERLVLSCWTRREVGPGEFWAGSGLAKYSAAGIEAHGRRKAGNRTCPASLCQGNRGNYRAARQTRAKR